MRDAKHGGPQGGHRKMPYYRCPACAHTVHSAGGRFTRSVCPECSALLSPDDRIHPHAPHEAVVHRRYPKLPQAAPAARQALSTLRWSLDPMEYEVAALLMTELVANSIKHSAGGTDDVVELDIALSDGRVRVEVRDRGLGFVPEPRTSSSPLGSNWGLHLVDQLSDRWAVTADPHTLVWFELDRVPAQGARAGYAAPALA
jgi:anti-sigma regulatory factor (Ser/Thr protein kinase)